MTAFANLRSASLILLLVPTSPAWSNEAFDNCVRRLCTSTSQEVCTIKAGAALCDQDQVGCITLPEFTSAKVLRKVGRRWEVQTVAGKGWVSDRMMMVDGTVCRP